MFIQIYTYPPPVSSSKSCREKLIGGCRLSFFRPSCSCHHDMKLCYDLMRSYNMIIIIL